jgi:hypothetical protein
MNVGESDRIRRGRAVRMGVPVRRRASIATAVTGVELSAAGADQQEGDRNDSHGPA